MMKKLVALVLVLGMCSLANAALTIGFDQPTNTVSISGDGGTPSPQAAYLLLEGPGSIAGGQMVYPGTLSAYQDLESLATSLGMTPAEALAALRDMTLKPKLTDLSFITLADGSIPPAALTGLLVDKIHLTWTGPDMVTLTLMSDDLSKTFETKVVPEPLTIALLGLGGLFLRRRR